MRIKYTTCFCIVLTVFGFLASSNLTTAVGASNCGLSRIQISAGTETSRTQEVIVTATPSCWSGSVGVNRGNVDTNLITLTVRNGVGRGSIVKIDTTQEVHPYASNPGMRGNNIIIPCLCDGTGLKRLSLVVSRSGKSSATLTVSATPSTWAGTVSIVTLAGRIVGSVDVPSSSGHVTLTIQGTEIVHAIYSGVTSNSVTLP